MSIFHSNLSPSEILSVLKDVKGRVHFVGVMGSGMYPLAKIMHRRGYSISGSDDRADTANDGKIRIARPRAVLDVDVALVVYSLAIDENNPEIVYAKTHGIPVISRAQLLGALMTGSGTRISVSGSHGKSTTTALIDHILNFQGAPHTTVCGARLISGETFTDSGDDVFVAEACEYKDSFLRLCPTHQIITSVELDHTDYFKTVDQIQVSFLRAAQSADVSIVNCDDPAASEIAGELKRESKTVYTYGYAPTADYRISSVIKAGNITRFSVFAKGREIKLCTELIGEFNLYNITAAAALADLIGVATDAIEKSVMSFTPIERRMTMVTRIDEIPVYYDYAHHPSEIRATLLAVKERFGAVTVIFRPHTYSRTESLWNGFISELSKADFTILLDIYPAREKSIPGVNSQKLAEEIENCVYANMSEAAHLALSRPAGAILLLGAGDVDLVLGDLIELGKSTGYIPERR